MPTVTDREEISGHKTKKKNIKDTASMEKQINLQLHCIHEQIMTVLTPVASSTGKIG